MQLIEMELNAILMHCDESVLAVNIGREFILEKTYLNQLSFLSQITDMNGKINPRYRNFVNKDDEGDYFICIHKKKIEQTRILSYKVNGVNNFSLPNEVEYLEKVIRLLQVHKEGAIALSDIFFTVKFNGEIIRADTHIGKWNYFDTRKFSLSSDEVLECNLLFNSVGNEYELIGHCINEFSNGLILDESSSALIRYITTLEMLLLRKKQEDKKLMLAKRIATLLGISDAERNTVFIKMKEFYKLRSDFVHEGKINKITSEKIIELERITRQIIKRFLMLIKSEIQQRPKIVWGVIKSEQIAVLDEKWRSFQS